MICPFESGSTDLTASVICYGIKVFLLIWIIFVPIAMTARLERIIKVLEDIKKE